MFAQKNVATDMPQHDILTCNKLKKYMARSVDTCSNQTWLLYRSCYL